MNYMKRLLAYLFIVLGLGLVFNNFTFASPDMAGSLWKVKGKASFDLPNNPYEIRFFKGGNCEYAPRKNLPCKWKQNGNKLFWEVNNYSRTNVILKKDTFSGKVTNNGGQNWHVDGKAIFIKNQIEKKESTNIVEQLQNLKRLYDDGVFTKSQFEKAKNRLLNIDDTKIVKKEPSKKKKVAKKSDNDWRKNLQVEGTVSEKNKASSKKKNKDKSKC